MVEKEVFEWYELDGRALSLRGAELDKVNNAVFQRGQKCYFST